MDIKEQINKAIKLLLTPGGYRTVIIFLLVFGAVMVYWYQIRPPRIYLMCTEDAKDRARNILKTRAELESEHYMKFVEYGLYLQEDYTESYKKCLRDNGMK